ncbi:hypothetical protein JD969_09800 [Planctomycetota bacterium]|nr:hypothetical protein JD969_09800 [Planctomycetota bacterium]
MFNDCKKLVSAGRVLVCALLLGSLLLSAADVWGASSRTRRTRRDRADRARQERMEEAEKKEAGEQELVVGDEEKEGEEEVVKEKEEVVKPAQQVEKSEPAKREVVMRMVKDELKVSGVKPERTLEVADFRVYGYMPDYVKDFWPKVKLEYLTDVIFFKAGINDKGDLLMAQKNVDLLKRMSKGCKSRGVKIHVAIGGWRTKEIQAKYVKVMTSVKLRRKLVQEIGQFVKKHRLDGFNLDWEYPDPGTQTKAYSEFIYELTKLLAKGKKTVGTAVMQVKPMLVKRGFAQDAVMTMTYDFQPVNSPFDRVQESINFWLSLMKKNGIKGAEGKLVMGVPFYGRSLTNWKKAKGYGTILKENPKIGEEVDKAGEIAFTNIKSMRERVAWAMDKKLKGVMIWQLGQDAVGEKSLLKAIYKEIIMKKGLPDFNMDGMLNKGDLYVMRKNWLKETDPEADKERAWRMGDLNLDGKVDGKDVGMVKKSWKAGGKALKIMGKAK